MKKIPSVFMRNYETDRLIRDEVVPGCEWVVEGQGIATRKWDGTACMIRGGELYRRYDAKKGKTPPPGFEPCQEYDEETGHMPGWVPVANTNEPAFREALIFCGIMPDGTYELCGPKVNGNPEGLSDHRLIKHGESEVLNFPRTFNGMLKALASMDIEGVVFHGPDGKMAKVKAKDFGIKREKVTS